MQPELADKIVKEAKEWLGTAWMHSVSIKGYRTDCVQFLISLFKNIGVLPSDYAVPTYRQDWALHNNHSMLIDELEKFCILLDTTDYEVGDILIFNYGRCASHAGVYIGNGKMIHSQIRDGVIESPIKEFHKQFHSAWRFK